MIVHCNVRAQCPSLWDLCSSDAFGCAGLMMKKKKGLPNSVLRCLQSPAITFLLRFLVPLGLNCLYILCSHLAHNTRLVYISFE